MLNTMRLVNRLSVFRSASNLRLFSSHAELPKDLGFRTNYSQEQTDKILDAVNKSSLLELKNYQISHQRIMRILKRREYKGNFECIEDLLEIDGFGIKILEKFCNSIINMSDESAADGLTNAMIKEQHENKRQKFVTPVLLEVIRNKAKSIVSFHVDLNYFAWTKIYYDRDTDEKLEASKFFVESWNCYEFAKKEKHLRLTDLIELMVKFDQHIPQADLYVLESLPPTVQAKQPGNALQVNVNIQKAQLVAMLCGLMASRQSASKLLTAADISLYDLGGTEKDATEIPYIDSVFLLKNFLPSRFYRILIGNERVSSANVINQIISYNYTMHNNTDPSLASVEIPEDLREFWKGSSRIEQEYLGSSLLVGLTFLKLCIERCSGSLERINSRMRKS